MNGFTEIKTALFNEYKSEAKTQYTNMKFILDTLDGMINPTNISVFKAMTIMSAGLYNKNKKDYERGYRLFEKACFEACDLDNYNAENTILFNMEEATEKNPTGETKNEEAYRQMCNWVMTEKLGVDKRHQHLLKFGYFN
jgi:hypothetical protein